MLSTILTAVFVLHFIAFLFLGARKRDTRFFVLSGTFLFLSTLYGLRVLGRNDMVAGTSLRWSIVLRIGAITCTSVYLFLASRRPGTWVHRFLRRSRDHV